MIFDSVEEYDKYVKAKEAKEQPVKSAAKKVVAKKNKVLDSINETLSAKPK